jgi:hypothetical protein
MGSMREARKKPDQKPPLEKVPTRDLIRSIRDDLERQRRRRERELASEKNKQK